jgi:hypothetical protein
MQKEKRIMPLPLQIKMIRRILRKANTDLDDINFQENGVPDPENEGEYYDWTTYLEEVSYPENRRNLEDRFPNINWRLPEEQKEPSSRPRQSLDIYECQTLQGSLLCIDSQIIVQSQKTFDKRPRVLKAQPLGQPFEYEFGRIQITVPKELIGIEAQVHIEFPNAPKIKKRYRRSRKVFGHFRTGMRESWSK